jgi:hypothetical protein
MNLSRTDPAKISTGSNGKKHFHSLQSDQPLVFTSVIVVDQCYLEDGKATSTGKLQKILKGMLLEGEFERFVGNIGMIIRSREFGAQIYKDILDFSTYMDGNGGFFPAYWSAARSFVFVLQRLCLRRLLRAEAVPPWPPPVAKQVPLYSVAPPAQPMAVPFASSACRPRTSVSFDLFLTSFAYVWFSPHL